VAALALGLRDLVERPVAHPGGVAGWLPALAWIAARAEFARLRRVALVVAGLVLVRLLLNWYVLDYAYGATPVLERIAARLMACRPQPSPSQPYCSAARATIFVVAVLEAGGRSVRGAR